MSEVLSAGIGRGQLKVLDLRIKQKTEIYNRYKEGLRGDCLISELQPIPEDTVPNHWLTAITVKEDSKVETHS